MNKRDRQIVEAAKAWLEGRTFQWRDENNIVALVEVIDRLDAENEKLKADLDKAINALVKS